MHDEIPVAGFGEWLKWLFGLRIGMRIEGSSMLPTLRPGDKVLIDPKAIVRVGDIVLTSHPFRSSIRTIKRLRSIEPDGRLFLIGDNAAESTDSRTFGLVAEKDVIGKVVAKLSKY